MSVHNQTWWDNNILSRYEEFSKWVGDSSAESKIYFREFLKRRNFESILDVGCGPATEFFALKEELPTIKYTGVDSSKYLNILNNSKGIPMIESPAHQIPLSDDTFDVVLSRHVLEHQPDFKPILGEMIRISSKLATHIFFIKPGENEIINFDQNENLYHNCFKKENIENYLKTFKKIKYFEWKEINQNENILLVWIKHD